MKEINVLFCILRRAREDNISEKNQVNIPLYDLQKAMVGKKYFHKAFVYQRDEIIIKDFDEFSCDKIMYMPSRTENSNYTDCLMISSSLIRQREELIKNSINYLVIIMEQPIIAGEITEFIIPDKIDNFKVILIRPSENSRNRFENYIKEEKKGIIYDFENYENPFLSL